MTKTDLEVNEYLSFRLENYVDNPVVLARIKARLSQSGLAQCMGVSQAYISKIEKQAKVSAKLLAKVKAALKGA